MSRKNREKLRWLILSLKITCDLTSPFWCTGRIVQQISTVCYGTYGRSLKSIPCTQHRVLRNLRGISNEYPSHSVLCAPAFKGDPCRVSPALSTVCSGTYGRFLKSIPRTQKTILSKKSLTHDVTAQQTISVITLFYYNSQN